MKNKANNEPSSTASMTDVDDSKRASLIKLGKRAAYISPAVLTMLTSQKATAASTISGPPGTP